VLCSPTDSSGAYHICQEVSSMQVVSASAKNLFLTSLSPYARRRVRNASMTAKTQMVLLSSVESPETVNGCDSEKGSNQLFVLRAAKLFRFVQKPAIFVMITLPLLHRQLFWSPPVQRRLFAMILMETFLWLRLESGRIAYGCKQGLNSCHHCVLEAAKPGLSVQRRVGFARTIVSTRTVHSWLMGSAVTVIGCECALESRALCVCRERKLLGFVRKHAMFVIRMVITSLINH
jgi:hypothetical protein